MIRTNREQYIETIRGGDDIQDKNVVLRYDGTFELVYDFDPETRMDFVGRSETLDAGNDYVGMKAASDEKYINKSYGMFLEAWIKYKKHDRAGQYLDSYPHETAYIDFEKIIDEL